MATILILGGNGNAGRQIARYALEQTLSDELIIAGRSLRKARATAQDLSCLFPGRRINALWADAANQAVLTEAFGRADFIINAASTIDQTENIARALLESGRAYLDTQLSSPTKLAVLRRYAGDFTRAGVCCITDGGFHPGLPAALVRYAAQVLDQLREAKVYSVIAVNWRALDFSAATRQEMVDELRQFQPLEYRGSRWRPRSYLRPVHFDFDPPFGRRYCVPMYLAEMAELPNDHPSLEKAGFYVTGFNPWLDYLLLPLIGGGARLLPRSIQAPLGKLLEWGLHLGRPPYGVQIHVKAEGDKYHQPRSLSLQVHHPDPYALTAMPVVACLQQWLRDDLRSPGLHYQAQFVEPVQFVADLRRMGLRIETNWQETKPRRRRG